MEALSTWYALPLHAVLDADASDVRQHPERWALLVGDLRSFEVSVVWATRSEARQLARRRRFLDPMGSFASSTSSNVSRIPLRVRRSRRKT